MVAAADGTPLPVIMRTLHRAMEAALGFVSETALLAGSGDGSGGPGAGAAASPSTSPLAELARATTCHLAVAGIAVDHLACKHFDAAEAVSSAPYPPYDPGVLPYTDFAQRAHAKAEAATGRLTPANLGRAGVQVVNDAYCAVVASLRATAAALVFATKHDSNLYDDYTDPPFAIPERAFDNLVETCYRLGPELNVMRPSGGPAEGPSAPAGAAACTAALWQAADALRLMADFLRPRPCPSAAADCLLELGTAPLLARFLGRDLLPSEALHGEDVPWLDLYSKVCFIYLSVLSIYPYLIFIDRI